MATFTTTAKHALRALLGSNQVLDVDAGFLALAQDIDALMAIADQGTALPTSSPSVNGKLGRFFRLTNTGQLQFDYGTGWVDLVAREAIVSALPTTDLYDGKEVLYRDSAMVTAGMPPWWFRYNASSSSTFKWEAKGLQEPLRHDIDGAVGGASIVAFYPNFAQIPGDPGPTLSTTFAGDWGYRMQLQLNGQSSTPATVQAGLSVAGSTPTILDPYHMQAYMTNATDRDTLTREGRINGLAAGNVLKMMYQWSQTVNVIRRNLHIWPIRVI